MVAYIIYYPDALLALKQQLTEIKEACRKVALSDGGLLKQRKKKQKDANKKSVQAKLPIPKQKTPKITGKVCRSTNRREKVSKISVLNQVLSQKDREKLSFEEVSNQPSPKIK